MANSNIALQRAGPGAMDMTQSRGHHRYQPFGVLDPQDEKLRKLIGAMYKWTSSVDRHFLEICKLSMRFDSHPGGITEQDIGEFQDAIASNEQLVGLTHNLNNYAGIVGRMFCNTSYIIRLWAPVISYLADEPVGLTRFNNKPPWTSWIMKLDDLCSVLPDLVLQMHQSMKKPYEEDIEDFWSVVKEKVAFIDELLIYAYSNVFAAWSQRRTDIGRAINMKLRSHNPMNTRTGQFKEIELPQYLIDKSVASTPFTERQRQVLLTSIFMVTIAVLIVAGFGLKYWRGLSGEIKDPSFYFLLASCILQLLGILIIWLTTPFSLSWMRFLLILAAGVATVAPMVTWVFIATEYSLGMALIGGALQNGVILQGMVTTSKQKVKTQ